MRRGHGLVEVTVALALLALIVVVLLTGRIGPAWTAFDPLVGKDRDAGAAEQQLRKLVGELQEATRVFYPLAGGDPGDGLGFIDANGDAVYYYLDPNDPGEPSTMKRRVLTGAPTGQPGNAAVWIANVRRLRVALAPVRPGKHPALVDIDLDVELPDRAGKGVRHVNFVTSAFPRTLETPTPAEVFPAGAPLVDP